MAREQRRTARVQPFVAPCRLVHGGRRLSGYLLDLSPLGARMASREAPPAVDTEVMLEVRFTRSPSWSRLRARVKWNKPDAKGHLLGLTFGDLEAGEQHALESALAEFQRRAAEIQ